MEGLSACILAAELVIVVCDYSCVSCRVDALRNERRRDDQTHNGLLKRAEEILLCLACRFSLRFLGGIFKASKRVSHLCRLRAACVSVLCDKLLCRAYPNVRFALVMNGGACVESAHGVYGCLDAAVNASKEDTGDRTDDRLVQHVVPVDLRIGVIRPRLIDRGHHGGNAFLKPLTERVQGKAPRTLAHSL